MKNYATARFMLVMGGMVFVDEDGYVGDPSMSMDEMINSLAGDGMVVHSMVSVGDSGVVVLFEEDVPDGEEEQAGQ